MSIEELSRRLDDLVRELRAFHGFRTLWLDLAGLPVHAEPEDAYEGLGWIYVGTFLRPTRDDLDEALARFLRPVTAASPEGVRARDLWVSPAEPLGATLAAV
jgi:hypothetical protein